MQRAAGLLVHFFFVSFSTFCVGGRVVCCNGGWGCWFSGGKKMDGGGEEIDGREEEWKLREGMEWGEEGKGGRYVRRIGMSNLKVL